MLYDTSSLIFLSTLSLRRATLAPEQNTTQQRDFYPRSPCGERRDFGASRPKNSQISIHALLAESDHNVYRDFGASRPFLSTLSLRRATSSCFGRLQVVHYFYPRSPCGERPPRGGFCYLDNIISIHALLAESDARKTSIAGRITAFLSTLSLRRATRRSVKLFRQNYISIHALLAESD